MAKAESLKSDFKKDSVNLTYLPGQHFCRKKKNRNSGCNNMRNYTG